MSLRHRISPAALSIPLLIAVLGLVLQLLEPQAVLALRHAVFDQFQRWQPRPAAEAAVRVVDIDEESLARLGQWPWPRTRLAELLQRLDGAGVAAVGFDVLFAEADRTSPAAMGALWQVPAPLRGELASLPDHDEAFAAALAQVPAALGFVAVERGAPPRDAGWPFRFVLSGAPQVQGLFHFDAAVMPLPALAQAAAGLGSISFVPDPDGVVRRVPMVFRLGEATVPALVAEVLRLEQRARNYTLMGDAHGGLAGLRIGTRDIITNPRGEVWVHYARPDAGRYLPAWRVLAGEADADLRGRLVLVGSSAQGLMDLRFNPVSGPMPGVEAHAQVLEQILAGDVLQRPVLAPAVESLALLLGCLAVVLAMARAATPLALGVLALVLGGLGWAGWAAFSRHGLLFDPALPALTVLLTFIAAGIARYVAGERRQRWIRRAFSRYVSPNLVAHLVAHPEQLALGGRRQVCSFVFTDLAGFTALMDKLDPAEAVALLNRYLDEMIGIAFRHQGTLDRIVGDAVAIMFSAPVPQADHACRALACAREMAAFGAAYAAELAAQGVPFGHTRVGVHTGEVIVGNFGGKAIFDYRALGDAVNTASRLEGANKYLGTQLCLSAATLAACPQAPVRPVGRLMLQGRSEALMAYTPAEPEDGAYAAAYALLAAGDEGALAAFTELAALRPEDALVRLHLARLRAGARDDLVVLEGK